MKFPEASEEGKKNGWEFSSRFLHKVHKALKGFPEAPFYTSYEIQQVLLAAKQVMEEQEKGFCDADYQDRGKEWGPKGEACRQVHGLREFFEIRQDDPCNNFELVLRESQVALDPEFSNTASRLLDEMIEENPHNTKLVNRELAEPGPEEPQPDNPFSLGK